MAAAERRQHLIETAIRLFTDGSYHSTTTAEIARAAGISEPILYRHFASKRELYLAALEHVWAKARAEWQRGDPELRRHLRVHMREVHDFVADLVRSGQAQGAIAAERDPDSEAWIMLAGGILGMVGRRVGLLNDRELAGIRAARLSWLRG
ncbi:MAG: hypothetical protein AUG91_04600 [Actinobacteria bacterium 13_1_20CM_4_69_9]|nr:MAG: hypothetical protein AUG91_04600 [Actinobacteria bacterium 13_1_20CM_4_69_9]